MKSIDRRGNENRYQYYKEKLMGLDDLAFYWSNETECKDRHESCGSTVKNIY